MKQSKIRNLNAFERSVLDRLFEKDFPGKNELVDQIDGCKVVVVDGDGSIRFILNNSVKRAEAVKARIPVEAEGEDQDGAKVQILLHVIDGKLDELEFWKSDSSPIQNILVENLKVTVAS